jgi:hypothetical protein
VDIAEFQKLFPELKDVDVRRTAALPTVQAAMEDLKIALVELSRCETGTRSKANWETTRDELLIEIRRLIWTASQRS